MVKIKYAAQQILILSIRLYQLLLSAWLGPCCRFNPSCSSYALTTIREYGPFLGFYMTLKRLLRCHPWHRGGYDPVP